MLKTVPRKSIMYFADAMESKLSRDDGVKPAWEKENVVNLYLGLLGEIDELADAKTIDDKMLECCDVALCAMMIYSNLHPELNELHRGREPEFSPCLDNRDRMPCDMAIMRGRL